MKKVLFPLLIACLSLFQLSANAQVDEHPVHWISLAEMQKLQETEPRKVLIDVYTQWCGPCKMMSSKTFTNAEVAEYLNKNYYCVKFDAESADSVVFRGQTFKNPNYKPNTTGRNSVHQFAQAMNVTAYPTLIFLNEKNEYLMPLMGYHTPSQLEIYLKVLATNDYLKIASQADWETYQKNFLGSWKD
jgi:thioredoxin-related protein